MEPAVGGYSKLFRRGQQFGPSQVWDDHLLHLLIVSAKLVWELMITKGNKQKGQGLL